MTHIPNSNIPASQRNDQRHADLDIFGSGAALLSRPDHDVVTVSGTDARSFLQSLVSQDLAAMVPLEERQSLLLQPQGKLVAAFRITMLHEEQWLLDCDPGVGAALYEGLARFKIRVKVDLQRRDDLATVTLRGPSAHRVAVLASTRGAVASRVDETAWSELPAQAVGSLETGVWLHADWPNIAGCDWIGPRGLLAEVLTALIEAGGVVVANEAFETMRVEQGVLVQGCDIGDATIAQEAELEHDSVSFTKGCFVGQELVCRIDSRGHVNRFVRRLRLSDQSVAVGASVDVNAKTVGTVTSVAPWSPWAIATLRREVEVGDQVSIGATTAVVEQRQPHASGVFKI